MNKIITTLGAGLVAVSLASAMEMAATATMMKDDMKASGTMMKHDDMMKGDKMMDKMMEGKMMMDADMEKMFESISSKSTKADIAKFQMMLIEKGYLKMPKGVAHGYYGNMTKRAVMKYKAAKMMMKDDMKKDAMMKNEVKASGTVMINN